nr:MAG TPA: hypothetical protein [Caudoviricetes sp.]
MFLVYSIHNTNNLRRCLKKSNTSLEIREVERMTYV